MPVYYEFLSGRYVQYYFFYANDDANPLNIADHEGDWERIVIRLSSTNTPLQVAYYVHNCSPKIYDWPNVPRVDNTGTPSCSGTHPIVWSALGTHGWLLARGRRRVAGPLQLRHWDRRGPAL